MSPRESDDEEDEVGTRAKQDRASRRNKRVKNCSRQVMQSPWSVHLTKLGLSTSVLSFSSSSFFFLFFFFSLLLVPTSFFFSLSFYFISFSFSSFFCIFFFYFFLLLFLAFAMAVTLSRHSSFFPAADYVCARETSPGLWKCKVDEWGPSTPMSSPPPARKRREAINKTYWM